VKVFVSDLFENNCSETYFKQWKNSLQTVFLKYFWRSFRKFALKLGPNLLKAFRTHFWKEFWKSFRNLLTKPFRTVSVFQNIWTFLSKPTTKSILKRLWTLSLFTEISDDEKNRSETFQNTLFSFNETHSETFQKRFKKLQFLF
jgi:hypothetical protein